MGRERNQPIMPVVRSSAMATLVWEAPNPITSAKMPGSVSERCRIERCRI